MVEGRRGGCLGRLIGLIILLVIVGVLFIYSGVYNVGANYPDRPIAAWVFSTTMDHSVQRHAASIKAPALDDPAMVLDGLGHYRQMCVGCHGAPGMPSRAKGFNPAPPELTEAAGDWKPSELFWIIKNGVRMSAMPGFAATHSDEDIWKIVAFVGKLPAMTPDEYKAMNAKLPPIKRGRMD